MLLASFTVVNSSALKLSSCSGVQPQQQPGHTAALQACNRKQRGKSKNKQHAGHVEVVKLLLAAIMKLKDNPVQIEVKQNLGYGGVTMGRCDLISC